MPTQKYCPNCGAPAISEGKKITCEPCDAVFTVTKDGAKVESLGRIEDHEKRIKNLEGKNSKPDEVIDSPAPDDQDDSPAPGDQDDDQGDDQDDEDLW